MNSPDHSALRDNGCLAYVVGGFPSVSETFILREMLALREMGYDLRIFALHRGTSRKVHRQALPLLTRTCYAPWFVFAPRRRQAAAPSEPSAARRIAATFRDAVIAAYFARRASRSGVRHVHAHFAVATADVARRMARRLGVKFSVSVHAWDIYAQPPPLLARRLADADFVATCSRYNREQLRMLVPDVPADRIHMIYHGVDPLEFSPDRRPGKNLVLAVGRLEEKKGLGGLVEACRRLRDKGMSFRCTIVGDGPERKRLQRLIAEYGLRTTVILEGELSQEELMPLYRKAAVLAVPSVIASTGDRDALPNVILEALAMEIPVVASRVGAIPEVIEDARTGLLVEPGDAAALAAAIERVLAEPSLGSRLAGTGRVLILERFNVRTNAAALGRLFAAGDR